MWLEMDVSGIKIKLQINSYKPTNKETEDDTWCKCDYQFFSGDWLNYHKENDEVLLSGEVEALADGLTELLDNKISEAKEIVCIEPDFIFKLYPKTDLRDDPNYIYIRSGYEIQDIYCEWKLYFWNGGRTENCLTITLYRKEIVSLRDYLLLVTNR